MTDPHRPRPDGAARRDVQNGGRDDELDPIQREVRAVLRDEPVDVDPQRRERAIAAALSAAGHTRAGGGQRATEQHGPVTDVASRPRRRPPRESHRTSALRPILAAAAALAVLGGTTAILLDAGSGEREDTASGSAEQSVTAGADRSDSGAADGGDTADEGATGSAERGDAPAASPEAPITTTSPVGPVTDLPHLGSFARRSEVLAAVGQDGRAVDGSAAPSSLEGDAGVIGAEDGLGVALRECVTTLQRAGATPLATATLDGVTVLVIRGSDDELWVVEAELCVPIHGDGPGG